MALWDPEGATQVPVYASNISHSAITALTLDLAIIPTNLSVRQISARDVTLAKEVDKEGPMAILVIKCPHTGRPISTGIEVDPREFRYSPDTLSRVKCPECGLDHAWWTREAWLDDPGKVGSPDKEAA